MSENKEPATQGQTGRGQNQQAVKLETLDTSTSSPSTQGAISENGGATQPLISRFNSTSASKSTCTISIDAIVKSISSEIFAEPIQKVRDVLANGKAAGMPAEELKRVVNGAKKTNLPAFSISGRLISGGRKQAFYEGRFEHSGYLQIDIDKADLDGRDPREVRDQLGKDPHILMTCLSPTGEGVKAIMRIPVCTRSEEHAAAFDAAARYVMSTYGLKIDPATKDPVRLFFATHDPDCIINDAPTTLPVEAAKADRDERRKSAPAPDIEAVRQMLACIPARPDYNPWLKILSAVYSICGEEIGTMLLNEWSPEEKPGEYTEKFKHRLKKIGIGYLIRMAKEHGYEPESSNIEIPNDIFPLSSGGVGHSRAAEAIFSVIGPSKLMYMRNGTVVEIIRDPAGGARFVPVIAERFCSLVEKFNRRVARREVRTVNGKEEVIWRSNTLPSGMATILLLTNEAALHLPHVRQLAGCPILTKDGEILREGYHSHGGGTFITSGHVQESMSLEVAVKFLQGLLIDFAFVTPSDKSRALACLLSPALKMGDWINDDYPMHVAEAVCSQSGKTYLLRLVCTLYNQRAAAVTAPRGGVGSLDETISATLIAGNPFITLDNFRGKLDSTILEQAIRGVPSVLCRALRVSAVVDTSPFMWQLSTNGAEFTRDIANRSVITRNRKQPPDHKFRSYPDGDLLAHVAKMRPLYLGAVFAVLREWAAKGCPRTNENRHDFRGWCQSLDWIVQNIFGMPPLLDGHREEQARTANPTLQWLREVVNAASYARELERPLLASDLVRIADDAGIDFPGSVTNRDEPLKRAGKLLARLFHESDGNPVIVDGHVVTREDSSVHIPGRGNESRKTYTIRHLPTA